MTTSTERAKELMQSLLEVRWPSESEALPLIAQALTEAENAVLEKAVQVASEVTRREKAQPGARYESEGYLVAEYIRAGIAALKSQEPSP